MGKTFGLLGWRWMYFVCQLKKKKKTHNLKVENDVFCGLTGDVSLGDSLSDTSEGLFWRDKEGGRYQDIQVFLQKIKIKNLKKPQTKNWAVWTSKDY